MVKEDIKILLSLCVFTMILTGRVWAVTHYVDPNGSGDFTTIQAAITASSGGDTIIVMEGVYVENINMGGKAITLQSTDPNDPNIVEGTIIDGGGSGTVITCNSGENLNTVIDGFTIRNGNGSNGGGMYNNGSSPTVSNCTFSGNNASVIGGGMFNVTFSSPTITNCIFIDNTASSFAAGMSNYGNSSPTVVNCIFSGNTSGFASGGMDNYDNSSPKVRDCTFSGNTAGNAGGGMYNEYNCSPEVTNCKFIGNKVTSGDGGGMYNNYLTSPTVNGCVFSGNTATGVGGGMYNTSGTSPEISNSLFCSNNPDQINGSYVDRGGNSISAVCSDTDGDGIDDWADDDDDNDSILDVDDNCPLTHNPGQEDTDGDGVGDVCEDSDGDGVFDPNDNCPLAPNPGQEDMDGDGIGDVCDDSDDDGVFDDDDNCPFAPNPGQEDMDGDGIGDACDDSDGDGVLDAIDNCVFTPNPGQEDDDGDGIGDVCEDADGDGVFDPNDNCPLTPNPGQEDVDGDDIGDACDDSDGDGVVDAIDNCVFTFNPGQEDHDSDGTGDVCETITVDQAGGGDFLTIQSAIDASVSGYTIIVMEGVYVENINIGGKAITLRSTDPGDPNIVEGTIIDGNESGSVIVCDSGEDANTVIDGFFITNGTGTFGETTGDVDNYYGGGMYNYGSSPTVRNCVFSGNIMTCPIPLCKNRYSGGGMCNYDGSSPTVSNCIFNGNWNGLYGGGMFNKDNSRPMVSNCRFSNNTAWAGGGISNRYSSPTVTNCTFSGNTANGEGGGMSSDFSSPTVINCTFSGNTTRAHGGGMCNQYDSFSTVINCTFSGNSATGTYGTGGGMFNHYNSSPVVSNCTFSGNTATGTGAYCGGGGMVNWRATPALSNCILWGNSAIADNEIYNDSYSSPVIRYSDIEGCLTGGTWDTSMGTDGGGNIDADPLFVDADGADDIAGTEDDNLRLSLEVRLPFGSPCIDAGDNDAVKSGIVTDIDGGDRFCSVIQIPDTGNGTGPIVDMGAYEFQQLDMIYVKADAVGANDGSSWEDAFKDLQDAVDYADPYDNVLVAKGTYYPDLSGPGDPREAAFRMKNNVAIYGGFEGEEVHAFDLVDRDLAANETILSGDIGEANEISDNCYHVFYHASDSNLDATAVLDGFTVTGGNADGDSFPHYLGGGMYNASSSPTVTKCKFTGSLSYYGGGMYNESSSPEVSNCVFSGNTAHWYGGGTCNFKSNPIVTNCVFSGNSSETGGGIDNFDSSPTVISCTFSRNTATSTGGGMFNEYYSFPTVTNSIFWGNTAFTIGNEIFNQFSLPVISYSNIAGGYPGTGNTDADPAFVDSVAGDFRISHGSPCIDTGDNNALNLPSTDIIYNPRIVDGDCNSVATVDMGAYEFSLAYFGDFDNNCRVNFFDFSIFGRAWETKEGAPDWDWACDISEPPDGYINWRDLAILCGNWPAGFE